MSTHTVAILWLKREREVLLVTRESVVQFQTKLHGLKCQSKTSWLIHEDMFHSVLSVICSITLRLIWN